MAVGGGGLLSVGESSIEVIPKCFIAATRIQASVTSFRKSQVLKKVYSRLNRNIKSKLSMQS